MLATVIDIQRWFQWVRSGCEGAAPDPIKRPGVKGAGNDHRRGRGKRSEMNKALGMDLSPDARRAAKVRALFRGGNTGPVRDLSKVKR